MVEPVALIGTRDPALSDRPTSAENGIPVLRLFHHSLYELRRGVRALFLMTVSRPELELVHPKLVTQDISYFVQELNPAKVNLFFGSASHVAVAQLLVTRPLYALTAEEDFMLGTLLGYDCEQQCRRFLTRSVHSTEAALAAE